MPALAWTAAAASCALLAAQRVARPGEINHAFVDRYSLIHGLIGVVTASFGLGFFGTLALAVGWEVIEHVAKNVRPAAFPHPTQDTLANSIGDVLSTMVGWAVTTLARGRPGHQPSHDSREPRVSFLASRIRLRFARRRP
jgi:hypothetical protein